MNNKVIAIPLLSKHLKAAANEYSQLQRIGHSNVYNLYTERSFFIRQDAVNNYLLDALINNKEINTTLIENYNPSHIKHPRYYALETAIKLGRLDAVKIIYNALVKSGHKSNLAKTLGMEVKGRPIYWLAIVCNSQHLKHFENYNDVPHPSVYFEIVDFLEKELSIDPDKPVTTAETYTFTKREYIQTHATDPQKKEYFLERL